MGWILFNTWNVQFDWWLDTGHVTPPSGGTPRVDLGGVTKMGDGFFSAFFWDPAGGGGKGGMPWDELTADIAVEVFFNDEAMYLYAMNRNDHQQKNFLGMKH